MNPKATRKLKRDSMEKEKSEYLSFRKKQDTDK